MPTNWIRKQNPFNLDAVRAQSEIVAYRFSNLAVKHVIKPIIKCSPFFANFAPTTTVGIIASVITGVSVCLDSCGDLRSFLLEVR